MYNFMSDRIHCIAGPHAARGLDSPDIEYRWVHPKILNVQSPTAKIPTSTNVIVFMFVCLVQISIGPKLQQIKFVNNMSET